MIREYKESDLTVCARIMMEVYNNELWQCHWTLETAVSYLEDYVQGNKFLGYTLLADDQIIGVIFTHEKIWWNNSEIFVDEMFITPAYQRKGYGAKLIQVVETYIKEHKLAGFVLTTNRFAPAPTFYRKNGFTDYDHVLCMGKVIE
jgi:aminoglycoside 6'-N-acetyltransferase I